MSQNKSTDAINSIIGANLKKYRNERNLTLDQVSELTGVSKSMLGQIERGESNPSVSVLWKIAVGLKISFTSLLAEPEEESVLINPLSQTPVTNGKDDFRLYTVFPFEPGRNFEVLYIEIEPGGVSSSSPHENGTEEYVIVYEGNLEVMVNNITYHVPCNHSIKYPGDKIHEYRNTTSQIVKLCMIISYAV